MVMNKQFRSIIILFFATMTVPAYSVDSLSGPLSLLLDEREVQLISEKFETEDGWEFRSGDNPDDPEGSDSGFSFIADQKLIVGGSQECGSPFGEATRTIDISRPVDNIRWNIKFESVFFDNGGASLKLDYGGLGIFVSLSERTIPFEVFSGFSNLTLIIQYKDGILSAKANGEKLLTPFAGLLSFTETDNSRIQVTASAGAADCFAGSRVVISSIIASSVLED